MNALPYFRAKKLFQLVSAFLLFIGLSNLAEASFESRFNALYYEKVAEKHYQTREIPSHLTIALSHYQKALAFASQAKARLLWKISRCYWLLGDRAVNPSEREKNFNLGSQYGKQAIQIAPETSNGHLWYGLSLGSAALEKGVMNTLYQKDVIKAELNRAIDLNPKEIGAYLGLAGWYYYVPRLFGGDRIKSFQIIDQALRIDPHFSTSLILKARFLLKSGKPYAARNSLLRLLAIEESTSSGSVEDRAIAREMLDEIKQNITKNPEGDDSTN